MFSQQRATTWARANRAANVWPCAFHWGECHTCPRTPTYATTISTHLAVAIHLHLLQHALHDEINNGLHVRVQRVPGIARSREGSRALATATGRRRIGVTHIGHSCEGGLAGSAAKAALTMWPILVQQLRRISSWK